MSLTVCADQRVNDEFLAVDSCNPVQPSGGRKQNSHFKKGKKKTS